MNNEQRDAALERLIAIVSSLEGRIAALEPTTPAEATDVRHEDDQPGQ